MGENCSLDIIFIDLIIAWSEHRVRALKTWQWNTCQVQNWLVDSLSLITHIVLKEVVANVHHSNWIGLWKLAGLKLWWGYEGNWQREKLGVIFVVLSQSQNRALLSPSKSKSRNLAFTLRVLYIESWAYFLSVAKFHYNNIVQVSRHTNQLTIKRDCNAIFLVNGFWTVGLLNRLYKFGVYTHLLIYVSSLYNGKWQVNDNSKRWSCLKMPGLFYVWST